MNIIVSGAVHIGKTTVCKKVIDLAQNTGLSCGGIITLKAPGAALSVVDIQTGKMATLAIPGDKYGGPLVPRFTFDPAGIDFGMQAIERGSSSDILLIDEIGIIEMKGGGFIRAFDYVNNKTAKINLLIVREHLLDYFIPMFFEKPLVYNITAQNRDNIASDIHFIIQEYIACQ